MSGASTLHIGFGAGGACSTGCGGHPNVNTPYVLSADFSIYQNSGGVNQAKKPILLIVGVAGYADPGTDPGRFNHDSIVAINSYNPYDPNNLSNAVSYAPTDWHYGSTAYGVRGTQPVGGGYQGYFKSGEIYSFLHLNSSGLSNSNSFTNWNAGIMGYSPTGPVPTGYEIYVFALDVDLAAKGLIDIQFGLDIHGNPLVPRRSYVLAYGQDSKTGKAFGVPFTEVALQTPEPGSWVLMSVVFVALGLTIRRKRNSAQAA